MTESTLLPNPPPLETIRVVCRLGLLTADSPEDADAAPDLRAIGGTVRIWSSAPRVVVDEADSRGRIVFPQAEPYTFRAADGELVDREDRVGVVLTNPLSPGINPRAWTWIAEVIPVGASSFRVTFGGESPLPPVVDLARTISVAETPGVSTLEQRVMALEAGGGGGTGPSPTLDVSWEDDVLTVNGEPSPPLTGPAPTVSWSGDQLVVGGVTGPHLTGPQGPPGSGGSGGASWVLVGPGRPDTPATTGGLVTGAEAVGMAYRSTDGAGVGAWEWVKRSTGWVLTNADSGWRTIPVTDLDADLTGTLYVRFYHDRVSVAFADLATTVATGRTRQLNLNPRFRPRHVVDAPFWRNDSNDKVFHLQLRGPAWQYLEFKLQIMKAGSGQGLDVTYATKTENPWPTTLPGTAI